MDQYKDFIKKNISKKIEEYKRVNYDIAYTYFQLKEYSYALLNFQTFSANKKVLDTKIYNDIDLRIADCHFALKSYWPAMEGYNKIIYLNSNKTPYAIYQKAISYGFVDRNLKKIETLKLLIKDFKEMRKDISLDDFKYW